MKKVKLSKLQFALVWIVVLALFIGGIVWSYQHGNTAVAAWTVGFLTTCILVACSQEIKQK
jgi:hypothetical protein